ncbi:MAG: hypothetical protein P4L83_20525 [Nevskia sp.]|nr:hypothetical protein [Nevskia sp.]
MISSDIQQLGAHARARGEHMVCNPYYKARNMPLATGEPVASWDEKARAWRLGWEQQNEAMTWAFAASGDRGSHP